MTWTSSRKRPPAARWAATAAAAAPTSAPAPAGGAGAATTAPESTPGVASVSAVSDQTAAELRAAIGELVEEVRTERMRRAEFGGLRLAAGLLQLLAVLFALLAVLQLGPDDAFFRWIAGAGLVQLAVIAVLVADARS